MDGIPGLGLLAVFLLVALNGFFVAAEFALVKVRKTRIDQLVEEGKGSAKIVQNELSHLDNYIAATQLGITLASLALGWIGEPALAHLIEPLFDSVIGKGAVELSHTIAFIFSFALITVFHIVLGELVPKSIALQRAEATSLFVARPLYIFAQVFKPFIKLMNNIGNAIVRLLGMRSANEHTSVHSVIELEMLVQESREAGVLDNQEEVMLRRVFDFGEKDAHQVMRPRTQVFGIPVDKNLDEVLDIVTREHYTRFPVFQGTIDNVIGVLHVKDLLDRVHHQGNFILQEILRPILKVPETIAIETLLEQMRSRQIHMALLIDEYGGTSGLVTLEDILEEIIGEVRDEFDTDKEDNRPEMETLEDGSSSVSGLLSLREFEEQFGVEFKDPEYETIGGYVFGQIGSSPTMGDKVDIFPYQLKVTELNELRIARLAVVKMSDSVIENKTVQERVNH
ncbi:MAG: HlyC/CorC family transporter [Chloroflexi bacterium]|jgi:putative hemolysin|nr:HlyC/CorC family transporter [Chloroflexota bacterium]